MVVHVNDIKAFKAAPWLGDSDKNCAACTAAGAVNLTIGRSEVTSKLVAQAVNKADSEFTMGEDVDTQIKNIRKYVERKTGLRSEVTDGEMSLADAENWMRMKPNKTVFAVFAKGILRPSYAAARVPRAHWLNAILAGGKIRYFDFQPMRRSMRGDPFVGHMNPATCTKPFVGVITQTQHYARVEHMHSPHQAGVFDDSVKLIVIAFMPKQGT